LVQKKLFVADRKRAAAEFVPLPIARAMQFSEEGRLAMGLWGKSVAGEVMASPDDEQSQSILRNPVVGGVEHAKIYVIFGSGSDRQFVISQTSIVRPP